MKYSLASKEIWRIMKQARKDLKRYYVKHAEGKHLRWKFGWPYWSNGSKMCLYAQLGLCICIFFRLLHSDRDKIPDVPAAYFVFPTEENIQRICRVSYNFLQLKFSLKTLHCLFTLIFVNEYYVKNLTGMLKQKHKKYCGKFFLAVLFNLYSTEM